MKKRLAICDQDERYRQMMQAYLIKRLKNFEILSFDSLEKAAEYSRKEAYAILLVSEHLYEKSLQDIQALQTFILQEDGEQAITVYPYIEKYQSMECLIGDILAGYSEEIITSPCTHRKKVRLHAFYSPVRKQEQTKAALALGQVLAKMDKKVLYLNLQPFAGWEELFQANHPADITDLLYFMRRQESNCAYRIQSMKQSLNGIDYLAPATDYMDLLQITQNEWLKFLDLLKETREYSEIILDLSEICQGLYSLLERSDCIYSMCDTVEIERNSINQYEKLLERRELSGILEKTSWLDPPEGSLERAINIERLHVTQLGEYMKGFTKENGNRQI